MRFRFRGFTLVPSRSLLVALLLATATLPAEGQNASWCWLRVRPAPACGSYLVTEASVEIPVLRSSQGGSTSQRDDGFDTRWTLAIGGMLNRSDSSAIGGLLTWDVDRGWAAPARGEARYRKWMGIRGLDISGGVAHRGLQGEGTTGPGGTSQLVRAWGPTAAVGMDFGYIGGDARVEVLRGDNRTLVGGFLGARATSAGAPVAVVGALAFIVALVATTGGS